nr:calmodulin-like protein 3 [Tanacetum cinerariifolium]
MGRFFVSFDWLYVDVHMICVCMGGDSCGSCGSNNDVDRSNKIFWIDVNKDGFVDMEEFGELYQTILGERDEEEDMREAFNVFDQNRDGFITVEELRSVLSSLGLRQGRSIEECRLMIKKVDEDGDGMVNYKEFKQMMKAGGFAGLET